MLTQLDVQNATGSILSLPFSDLSSGYVVKEIDGLGPVDAAVTSTSMAQFDGAQFQNARRDIRNITIKLGFQPDWTMTSVTALRMALYDWFSTKSMLMMKFWSDNGTYKTAMGCVETCSDNRFSSDPEVDISIICFDPDFYASSATVISGNTVTDGSNKSIVYDGTTEAGIVFVLSPPGGPTQGFQQVTLTNTQPGGTVQQFHINYAPSFFQLDVVTIDSIPGEKTVKFHRSGIDTSALSGLDATSVWISLKKGTNLFRATAQGSATYVYPYTLTYTSKYGAL